MKGKGKKSGAGRSQHSGPDLREVSEILDFMEKHGLEEFEYENGNFHVRLRKAQSHSSVPFRAVHAAPEIVVAHPSAASPAAPESAGSAPAPEPVDKNLHVIKSPIVGTFYSSPTPSADPFVRAGEHVKSGQVLCIIEAMKLMNEIEADVAGEVMRVFVENGQPVEYGEPLFAIHPSRKQ